MSKHIDDGMQVSRLHKKIARPVRCILLDSETLAWALRPLRLARNARGTSDLGNKKN